MSLALLPFGVLSCRLQNKGVVRSGEEIIARAAWRGEVKVIPPALSHLLRTIVELVDIQLIAWNLTLVARHPIPETHIVVDWLLVEHPN